MTDESIKFTKMHGLGNDFAILDLRDGLVPTAALCKLIGDRRYGVGCDLILGVEAPRTAEAAASYRIWTADGDASQQCGNGARCVAAWSVRAGMAKGKSFVLDSPAGSHMVEVLPDGIFRISMGLPSFDPARLPLEGIADERDSYGVDLDDGAPVRFAAVSMGNPHAVIQVDDVEQAPVERLGPALRRSSLLPRTVNVGFAQVESRRQITLRVHEYGAGETLACGTGACAAAAVFMRRGQVDRDVAVALRGGRLRIAWPSDHEPMTMAGPAAFVFEGELPFPR